MPKKSFQQQHMVGYVGILSQMEHDGRSSATWVCSILRCYVLNNFLDISVTA